MQVRQAPTNSTSDSNSATDAPAPYVGSEKERPKGMLETMRSATGMIEDEIRQLSESFKLHEVTAHMNQDQNDQGTSLKWTQSNQFSLCVGVFVILNAIGLGVEADYGDDFRSFFVVAEHIFTAVFTSELLLHFLVEGPREYFSDSFNWLDCFLVVMSIVDVWIIGPLGGEADLRCMSVLRMLRLIRLARLLRLFRVFKELTLLVTGFITAVRTLFWAFIFLLCVVYSFAIFAHQTIGQADACDQERRLKSRGHGTPDESCDLYTFGSVGTQHSLFGTLSSTMLTLFLCLTEGCGMDIVKPIVSRSPAMCIFWLIFTFSTTFGLLNLIVGCFCENAMHTAAENEKELEQHREAERERVMVSLKDAFLEMDEDKNLHITRDEFNKAIVSNQKVINALVGLGLGDEADLFGTLDAEEEGSLTFNQFFDGLMLIMKGHEVAKAKDIVATLLTCQAVSRRGKRQEKTLEGMHDELQDLRQEVSDIRKDVQALRPLESPKNCPEMFPDGSLSASQTVDATQEDARTRCHKDLSTAGVDRENRTATGTHAEEPSLHKISLQLVHLTELVSEVAGGLRSVETRMEQLEKSNVARLSL